MWPRGWAKKDIVVLIHNQSKYEPDTKLPCRTESIHQCDDRQKGAGWPISSIRHSGSLPLHQETHQTAKTADEVPTWFHLPRKHTQQRDYSFYCWNQAQQKMHLLYRSQNHNVNIATLWYGNSEENSTSIFSLIQMFQFPTARVCRQSNFSPMKFSRS